MRSGSGSGRGRECGFPAIFNFGDSNSDTGGLSAAFGQAPPPNGITFFHAPKGRFSDDRLIIDFIGIVAEGGVLFRDYIYLDIGQIDLTAGYKLNLTTEQVKAHIPDVLGQFSNVIKGVYGDGGRSFWIHNTGPLGCLPYMLDRYAMKPAQMEIVIAKSCKYSSVRIIWDGIHYTEAANNFIFQQILSGSFFQIHLPLHKRLVLVIHLSTDINPLGDQIHLLR